MHGREHVHAVQAPQVQVVDVSNALDLPQRGLDRTGVEVRRNFWMLQNQFRSEGKIYALPFKKDWCMPLMK